MSWSNDAETSVMHVFLQQGVALGDIITSVAELPTRTVEELLSVVEQQRVGDVVDVAIFRMGTASAAGPATATVRVQLVERQQMQARATAAGGGGNTVDVDARRRSRM